MSYKQHRRSAKELIARCAVVTLSDTRTVANDSSGKRICDLLAADGHQIADYRVIRDDPDPLRELLTEHIANPAIDLILTTGGTGTSRRDQTIPVIESLIDSPIPGFGELFRMLSWQEIASGAMLSRAIGGIAKGKPIFAMPGSTAAVELAMTKLILPEIRHLLFELQK